MEQTEQSVGQSVQTQLQAVYRTISQAKYSSRGTQWQGWGWMFMFNYSTAKEFAFKTCKNYWEAQQIYSNMTVSCRLKKHNIFCRPMLVALS